MKATIQIANSSVFKSLRLNEELSFGSSSKANVLIDDRNLGEKHFSIAVRSDGCFVSCFDRHTVTVNGIPSSHQKLSNQDTILAGSTPLQISLEGFRDEAVDAEPIVKPLDYSQARLVSNFRMYQSIEKPEDLVSLWTGLGNKRSIAMFVNYRAARLPIPENLSADQDLFRHAPEEIRDEHSLFLVPMKDAATAVKTFEPLRQRDAAVVLFASKPVADVIAELKFHFAWFAKPSLLQFHLRSNNANLVRKLIAPLDLIYGEDVQTGGWWTVLNSETVTDWQAAGFPNAPINGLL